MSSIDSNSQAHLNSILDKIGVKNAEAKKPASKDNLGQGRFLETNDNSTTKSRPFCSNGKC